MKIKNMYFNKISIFIILAFLLINNDTFSMSRLLSSKLASKGLPTRSSLYSQPRRSSSTLLHPASLPSLMSPAQANIKKSTMETISEQSQVKPSWWNRAITAGKQSIQSLKNIPQIWRFLREYEKDQLLEQVENLVHKIFENPERRREVLHQLFIPYLIQTNKLEDYLDWDEQTQITELEKWVQYTIPKEKDYEVRLHLLSRLFRAKNPHIANPSLFTTRNLYEIKFLKNFVPWLSEFSEKGESILYKRKPSFMEKFKPQMETE